MPLTKQDALEMLKEIEKIKWDNEAAHWEEDKLMRDFITSCSLGEYSREEMIEMANIVLKSREIDFTRWYA